jgi:GntR family transcriptional regulator/MocR family aminotransferase
MRALYRGRREAMLAVVRAELPETEIGGISAGLHATVRFPRRLDEAAILESALKRGMGLSFLRRHYLGPAPDESTLLLSYASMPESALRTALRTLAAIIEG